MLGKEFRYILTVAECGSVTKAAEKLFISQPALSRYINDLENSMDIKLFDRIGKKMLLTEFGKHYVSASRRIIDIANELDDQIKASDETICGSLRIGCARRGAFIIPRVLPEFFKQFPKVKLSMYESDYDDILKNLISGKVDIAILKEPPSNEKPNVELIPLFYEELVLVVPISSPLIKYADYSRTDCAHPWIDLSYFANEHFILYKTGHINRALSEAMLHQYNIYPEHFFDTNNIEGALNLVQAGQGVCFSPEIYSDRCLKLEGDKPSIRVFSVGNPVKKFRYCVAYRPNTSLTKYTRTMIRLLQQEFFDKLRD